MKALLGKKAGMTQLFLEDGKLVPVTVVEASPSQVIRVKTEKKEGYAAIQIGFGEARKINQPSQGHFEKAKTTPKKHLAEVLIDEEDRYETGQTLTVETFSAGEKVDVAGISKGKGFQGVIKKWGFKGGPASHGSHFKRIPGSIGASATPSRVFKGKKMPGRLGGKRVTVKNLSVVKIDSQSNLLLLKGAVPGAKGQVLLVKNSLKFEERKKDAQGGDQGK